MGKAEQRNASQKQAEYMRAHNITRDTGRCPVCNAIVSNGEGAIRTHFAVSCGKRG